ncbi:hypothetical protein [Tellurirhabdus bombi]|uniref:hypothetical protein n=1 Tax=Tellurirhabdus bombi TaxID=2907205 RepID=UPI001F4413C7|nr:hypothetical protein [Tellurirhabdus bombi]
MLTLDQIMPYLNLSTGSTGVVGVRHEYLQKSIDHRKHLEKVFSKAYPDYLDKTRPKERAESKLYRKEVYKNTFRGLQKRVIKSLDYIREADDFSVVWPESEEKDTLEAFADSRKFSPDGSALNWFFKQLRPLYVKDPNAVLVVLPMLQAPSNTEYVAPKAMLVPCDKVYMHRKGKFAVLEAPEKSTIVTRSGDKEIKSETGRILLFLDADSYTIARQIGKTSETGGQNDLIHWEILGLTDVENEQGLKLKAFSPPLHHCPVMPAVKIGKDVEESNDFGEEYFESILADALPSIELAQGNLSDIQVEMNFHVSSQEWRYATKRCPDAGKEGYGRCVSGSKAILNEEGVPKGWTQCTSCKGTGMEISGSGMDFIVVSPPSANSTQEEGRPAQLPTPPGGFIPRSIEPLTKFTEQYNRNKEEAYQEINMQFLMRTPYDESGASKRYDREEMYRELNTQGAHLCGILSEFYTFIGHLRYQGKVDKQLPNVLTPVRFNLENAELTRNELIEATKNKFDPNLRKALEKKLISYQAGENSDYYRRYELREKLDPLPGLSPEEKMFQLSLVKLINPPGSPQLQKAVERIMFSIHLDGLISEAILEDKDFLGLKLDAQREKLITANKELVGEQGTFIGLDGKPVSGSFSLQPLVDAKNLNQL